jgi:hypothetical protein
MDFSLRSTLVMGVAVLGMLLEDIHGTAAGAKLHRHHLTCCCARLIYSTKNYQLHSTLQLDIY